MHADRADLWTFHDPAVRVASVFGSGGEVDVLSQWTYSYPEPLRIGLPTDELLAMARGASTPQRVMKMTQLIWYRSQTAPIAEGNQPQIRSPWDDHDPDAAYITIAPMHLREAFWTKISRPIQGIMYHGWQSLVPTDYPSSYRYTHPETQHELRRLVHEIVEPLGPDAAPRSGGSARRGVLREFRRADVRSPRCVRLEPHLDRRLLSGACSMPVLQADVLYDESITRFGLDDYKVLVMPDADVLTRSVAERTARVPAARRHHRGRRPRGPGDHAGHSSDTVGPHPEERTWTRPALLALAATLRRSWLASTSGRPSPPIRMSCRFAGRAARQTTRPICSWSTIAASSAATWASTASCKKSAACRTATVTLRGQSPRQLSFMTCWLIVAVAAVREETADAQRLRSAGRSRLARAMAVCFSLCRARLPRFESSTLPAVGVAGSVGTLLDRSVRRPGIAGPGRVAAARGTARSGRSARRVLRVSRGRRGAFGPDLRRGTERSPGRLALARAGTRVGPAV